jgi:anti-sigma factor RsiW
MKECWKTGDLRAYVDRELAPDETARLEAHLESCAECAEQLREISARAGRVGAMLTSLAAEPAPLVRDRKGAARATWGRAAALAIAASLALVFLAPKAVPPPKTAHVARPFIALDNEPIETGMVVRVAFGPHQVQADVIIAPDGRPRAYRLVENPSINEGVKTE